MFHANTHDLIGCRESLLHVTRSQRTAQCLIVRYIFEKRLADLRIFSLQYGIEGFIVDLDQICCIEGGIERFGNDRNNWLANCHDGAPSQDRKSGNPDPFDQRTDRQLIKLGDICATEYCDYLRRGLRCRNIKRFDFRSRVGTSYKGDVQTLRTHNIIDITSSASQKPVVLEAPQRCADPTHVTRIGHRPIAHLCNCHGLSASRSGRKGVRGARRDIRQARIITFKQYEAAFWSKIDIETN